MIDVDFPRLIDALLAFAILLAAGVSVATLLLCNASRRALRGDGSPLPACPSCGRPARREVAEYLEGAVHG